VAEVLELLALEEGCEQLDLRAIDVKHFDRGFRSDIPV
jgi:hypothetical protein